MHVKKNRGKVYGASFSHNEKKAIEVEIQKQLAEYDKNHAKELSAMVLWVLHTEFGFGKTRLKRFYDTYATSIDNLIKRYDLDDSDQIWLCTKKLKDAGIDIEEWATKE